MCSIVKIQVVELVLVIPAWSGGVTYGSPVWVMYFIVFLVSCVVRPDPLKHFSHCFVVTTGVLLVVNTHYFVSIF